jgi:hypothetical protein
VGLGDPLAPPLELSKVLLVPGLAPDNCRELPGRHGGQQVLTAGAVDAVKHQVFFGHDL